jgi:hypothetical protein
MDLRGLIGIDLSGRFSALKREYDKGSIDESAVGCQTRWGNGGRVPGRGVAE